MTSPERYAALIFPPPRLHHTHTHAHRDRERSCPPRLCAFLPLLLLLQPTHPTWGVYRDDTTLHITHLRMPNSKTGPRAFKRTAENAGNDTQLSSHLTSSATRKERLIFLCNSCLILNLQGDILTNANLKCGGPSRIKPRSWLDTVTHHYISENKRV